MTTPLFEIRGLLPAGYESRPPIFQYRQGVQFVAAGGAPTWGPWKTVETCVLPLADFQKEIYGFTWGTAQELP